ncbi:Lrp/AsnC family transcriptional regulator [Actinoallomurus rhizosphaericola]|uniref:Lrp/AsnC family transcriptional regulator n=1 Tax=Actinoallomurus rhizosphaericola TaxID=2952536 RepID=UPI0020924CF5|nr:AsnC family transcriptional regulator [Actinoallomurus rhizosphaericola]MCO5999633.1 Lrp/AsnC family transcriptional regulator [Actinoallomurus rhizosphaericola]
MKYPTLDELDRHLVHALQLDGRAPFSKIGEVLGVSDQTVARRYRRLRTAGALRVVGAVDPLRVGLVSWAIRLRATPDAAGAIATALARRPDTYWVHLLSGGTEIACGTMSRTPEERADLLLQKLPRTGRVSSVTAHALLHQFVGGPIGWAGARSLPPEQAERLRPDPPVPGDEPVALSQADYALLAALSVDGRAGHAELASATGWSQSTVRRRMDQLRRAGVLFYDLDLPAELFGYPVEARLWLSVEPSRLAAAGEALAGHSEVAFAAATTGPTNLLVAVTCRDPRHLYRYLTERVGALEGVRHVETAPVIRTVKGAGATLFP